MKLIMMMEVREREEGKGKDEVMHTLGVTKQHLQCAVRH